MPSQHDSVNSLLCGEAHPGGHVLWRLLQPLPGQATQEGGAVGVLAPGSVVMPAGIACDEHEAPCRQDPPNSHVHRLVEVAPTPVDPDDRDGLADAEGPISAPSSRIPSSVSVHTRRSRYLSYTGFIPVCLGVTEVVPGDGSVAATHADRFA